MANPLLDATVQAFRDAERADFLAERKRQAHSGLLLAMVRSEDTTDEDRAAYAVQTQAILDEYEAKRAKAGL
jgi:hypothetical protein